MLHTLCRWYLIASYNHHYITCDLFSSSNPVHRWELDNSDSLGGVVSLDHYDITADGVMDLLVGRDDGSVEIFGFDEADEPVKRFSQVTHSTCCLLYINMCCPAVKNVHMLSLSHILFYVINALAHYTRNCKKCS